MLFDKGRIKQLYKGEELASARINILLDSPMNIWSTRLDKIDNIFEFIIDNFKEQRLILDGIEQETMSRTSDIDSVKILLFTKNKERFEKMGLPKELLFGERILTVGDEDLLNYLLETIFENMARDSISPMYSSHKINNIDDKKIDEELKTKLAIFYNEFNSQYRRPYIFIMVDDVSYFIDKNKVTFDLLLQIFNADNIRNVFSVFGSVVNNNLSQLLGFTNARITLIDKFNETDLTVWKNENSFGLGDISKLENLSDEDYLCFKGNLYDQGRENNEKPFIITIKNYEVEKVNTTNYVDLTTPKIDRNKKPSLLNTFPQELVEYKYALQEEEIKNMQNFCDAKRTVVKDIKSLLLDYMEFDDKPITEILNFLNENFLKIRNELNYRLGEFVRNERTYKKRATINRCLSLGKNMEISETIKIKNDELKIKYDWQLVAYFLCEVIKDLWNIKNSTNQIEKYHFYKYPLEYRKRYDSFAEWEFTDLT